MNDRYFKKEWEESYYIFDSETITEKEVDESIEYDYTVFSMSMTGDEIVDRLNTYSTNLIQAGKLIEKGVEIANENRHIKQTIKDMIENERTDIGKNTLKQLYEAIQ